MYVSIHSHKISKYNKKTAPKIYKLGSNAWKILKQNQGARQTYCIQLIQCMLKEDSKGFQFAPDSYLQNELESSYL
jgi:transcription-repair coupling factor (superfamily II helicase)